MQQINILLVDDEEQFRRTLSKRLSRRGFLTADAQNGDECLRLMENSPFDVVVMDVKMPGMSGIETLQKIKESFPRSEVILLTGHASTQDGVEGIKAGAFDYLGKPVELDHLIGKIKQAWDKIKREEERQKEREFREKMEQQISAAERLASLGTLATGVAHEINNPLAIISESAGWIRLIIDKNDFTPIPRKEDLDKALDKIEKAIERAKRITQQLLGIARKTDSSLAETRITDLMAETVQLFQRDASNREIQLILDVKEEIPPIWTDPYQLRQVFINLFANAMHSIGSSGSIRITAHLSGESLSIEVEDSGTGIPRENLERIFEPFFSTKAPGEGTGLGLFVTRNILDRLGGSIRVESELGKGTTFTVTVPRRPPVNIEQDNKDDTGFFDKIFKKM